MAVYCNCCINVNFAFAIVVCTKRQNSKFNRKLVFVENQRHLFNAQMNNFFLRLDFCNEDELSPDAVFDMRFLFVFPTSTLCICYKPFQAKRELLPPQLRDFSDCIIAGGKSLESVTSFMGFNGIWFFRSRKVFKTFLRGGPRIRSGKSFYG